MSSEASKVKIVLKGSGEAVIDWDGEASETVTLSSGSETTREYDFGEDGSRAIRVEGETITYLKCDKNELTKLDISDNPALTELSCYYNRLMTLDVTKNTALLYLNCNSNRLKTLDVTKNTALTSLFVHENSLTGIDVTKNIRLVTLAVGKNIPALDVSKNTRLETLGCNDSDITSLDVTANPKLKYLICYGTKMDKDAINALFGTLPKREEADNAVIEPFSLSYPHAGEDIAIAKARGWEVKLPE